MFTPGQEVICVDASPAANPWHRAHPLVLKKLYIVRSLAGVACINIDNSKRAWQNWRFRPVVYDTTNLEFADKILHKANRKQKDNA